MTGPATDPGALDRRMTVLERSVQPDGMGGSLAVHLATGAVWGRFEPEAPGQRTTDPFDDRYARGTVFTRLGRAPAPGARLRWSGQGTERTVEIVAVEPGSAAFPFDRCLVRELDREPQP